MKVKLKNIKEILFAWVICIITILMYYGIHNINLSNTIYAIIKSLFSSITLIYVLNKTENLANKGIFTCASALIIITALYDQNSLTKFSVDKLFDGFISDNLLRLLGGIYVDIIIIVTTHLITRMQLNGSHKNNNTERLIYVSTPIMYLLVIIFGYITLFVFNKSAASTTRLESTIRDIISYLTYASATIYAFNRKNKNKLFAYFPIILITIINLYKSLQYGGKATLLKFAVIIAFGLYYFGMVKFKTMKSWFIVSPIILQLYTIISELTSNRMANFNSYYVLQYHAFRLDLSDFALTIAIKANHLKYATGLIKDAFVFCIPGYSPSVKNDILLQGAYRKQLLEAGLPATDIYGTLSDFNDTLFSIGAELSGFVGMFLFYLLIAVIFELISRLIIKNKYGYAIALVAIEMASLVECDLLMLTYTLRDMILIVLIATIWFNILGAIKSKRYFNKKAVNNENYTN